MNKGEIAGYIFLILCIIGVAIFCYFAYLEPTIDAFDEHRDIKNTFKNADFNISDDYAVEYITGFFGDSYRSFKDTDWYSWKTLVYVKEHPSSQSTIVLWINIETEESYYIGVLPELI